MLSGEKGIITMKLEQTKKAGGKEFFLSILVIALLALVISYIRFILPAYKTLADIAGIILFVVFGFFVLTRYGAVYRYLVDDNHIRLTRIIGKRCREVEFSPDQIIEISRKKPKTNEHYTFSRFILPHKHTIYITVEKEDRLRRSVALEADRDMLQTLEHIKTIK